jgi:pilus assembly protein CpaF
LPSAQNDQRKLHISIQPIYHQSQNDEQTQTSGLGILESLLDDSNITDILVNGHKEVWIDQGQGLEKTKLTFLNEESVRSLAQKLALSTGRRLDQSQPYVDAQLTKTIRLHAVLTPIASPGTSISLRIHRPKTMSLTELVINRTLTTSQKNFLTEMIKNKKSFVICGGTGSGKTTLLNSLLSDVGKSQRILIIEDSRELNPQHPHVVSLEGRPANIEGMGLITMKDLIKQSLRMRADRLIIGEVRGAEVIDWLSALNTGHTGSAGTIHANSIHEVITRFEPLGLMAGLSKEAIHSQLKTALNFVIHIERNADGKRQVRAIGEFQTDSLGYSFIQELNI